MPAMPDHPAPLPPALSPRTTPTWEVELLISAAAVFAMLQLPGWLDERYLALDARLDADLRQIAMMTYLYAKSVAVMLAITFIVHLALRARWIALVGVDSVYPGGIRTDRLRMGPIQREVEGSALSQATSGVIERADNRASLAFAMGVVVAGLTLGILVFVAVSGLTALALGHLLHLPIDAYALLMLIFLLMLAPMFAAAIIDHWFGARLPAGSWLRRSVARVFRGYQRLGMGRDGNWIYSLLSSHGGERKAMLMQMAAITLTVLGVAISLAAMKQPQRLGSYGLFPQVTGVNGLLAAHYDDQRDPGRDEALPFVPSAVIDEAPYLRLIVPYRPMRDASAMQRRCAHAAGIDERNARSAALLACLQQLHAVTLDGQPVPGLRYEATVDARTRRPALLAMIDIRHLAPGRHELRIARPSGPARSSSKDRDPGFDRIVFWR